MAKAKTDVKESVGFDIFDHFETDESLEKEGVWVDYLGGTKFLIASTETPAYQAAYAKVQKKLHGKGGNAEDVAYAEVFARHLLLDWNGLSIKGEVYPYSFENAVKLMIDVRQVALFVLSTAADFQTFKAKQEEEEEKN